LNPSSLVLGFALTAAFGALLNYVARAAAVHWSFIDKPSARSSHSVPTPRGGGVSIVISSGTLIVGAYADHLLSDPAILWILSGATLLAAVGLVDDRIGLPWQLRLTLQFLAALLATNAIGLSNILGRDPGIILSFLTGAVLSIAGTWSTNLFNFMDGINGIAAFEAIFIGMAGSAIALASGVPATHVVVLIALAGAAIGFLPLNFPTAKIFMGDVGSGFLGYALFFFPLLLSARDRVPVLVWCILWGAFLSDATVTLIRRTVSRERILEAHRSHLYQRLARRWGSHVPVTLVFCLVNIVWLLPLALAAALLPQAALALTAVALLPLLVVSYRFGAGAPD
jgi:Fuc2NAc and GlcNAc transferase